VIPNLSASPAPAPNRYRLLPQNISSQPNIWAVLCGTATRPCALYQITRYGNQAPTIPAPAAAPGGASAAREAETAPEGFCITAIESQLESAQGWRRLPITVIAIEDRRAVDRHPDRCAVADFPYAHIMRHTHYPAATATGPHVTKLAAHYPTLLRRTTVRTAIPANSTAIEDGSGAVLNNSSALFKTSTDVGLPATLRLMLMLSVSG
jgi:hypothetical protein